MGQGVVNKANRKLVAGAIRVSCAGASAKNGIAHLVLCVSAVPASFDPAACLLLAAKVNDPKFVINGNFPPLFDVRRLRGPGRRHGPSPIRGALTAALMSAMALAGADAQSIEKHMDVSLRDVMDYEFAVFAALDFDVHPPPEEILPHFYRIVSSFNRYSNVQEYLGEKMHSIFFLDEKA